METFAPLPAPPPDIACLCLDFETANYDAFSAIALGLCALNGAGDIVMKQSWLFRPPGGSLYIRRDFIAIHGITSKMIRDKPEFGDLWPVISPWMTAAPLLAAHNAGFDRRVLEAASTRAGIDLPRKNWVCTVNVSRRSWPGLFNHKLNTVCEHIGFALQHHDAGSDSEAVAHILREAGEFPRTGETVMTETEGTRHHAAS